MFPLKKKEETRNGRTTTNTIAMKNPERKIQYYKIKY